MMQRAVRLKTPIPGPKSTALVQAEASHLAPGTQNIWRLAGIAGASGDGAVLIDADDNHLLDWVAGICVASLGYNFPGQAEALFRQAQQLMVGSYTSAPRVSLLARLARLMPKGSNLTRTQLYSGGAEAVESALRLARAVTGKFEVVSFWGAFHGKTQGVLGLMGSSFKHGLGPQQPGLTQVPYADCYRCPFKLEPNSCGLACVDFMRESIKKQTTNSVAAVIVEPIQGTGGNILPPDTWLPAVQEVAKEFDALLIADEMITGFGRSGTMFGIEHSGVNPDIVTMGKALGGGFPVSGLITTDALSQAKPWSNASFSSSSYGGNPLAAAAADFAVAAVEDHALHHNAKRVGDVLLPLLQTLVEKYPFVGAARGRGLMLAVELVEDAKTRKPLHARGCEAIFRAALKRGLVTMAYGPRVRINPPLVTTVAQAEEAFAIFDDALAEVHASGAWR